ncbi:MAG: hypothetical protein NXI27_12500 [Alphaproteobacteria bacterium]|nr:hypothetical protein [Alphaproteobacteria bacterium]
MDRLALFLVRLMMITLGFMAASITAGVALALLTEFITLQEAGRLSQAGLDFGLVIGALGFASLVGYVAFFPALLVIFYAELTKRRDWLFYALAGGIIAAAAPFLVAVILQPAKQSQLDFALMMTAAGMMGGIVYWLVAGRSAGHWLPSAREKVNAPPSEEF